MNAAAPTRDAALIEAGDMLTVSGVRFSLAMPRPEMVVLEDIAHGLSMACRYAGQVRDFYSVAQHSVLVAESLRNAGEPPAVVRWGLCHDAAEAYVGDVTRPVKKLLRAGRAGGSAFDDIEDRVLAAIAERFKLGPFPAVVHQHDQAVCAREQLDLGRVPPGWVPPCAPAAVRVDPWSPGASRYEFLREAKRCELELGRG